MSFDVEQMMARELDGKFFTFDDTGRTVQRNVPLDYMPSHASTIGTNAGEENPAFKRWTAEDDETLLTARHRNLQWFAVAKTVRRNRTSCYDRYLFLCKERGITPLLRLPPKPAKGTPYGVPKMIVETCVPPPARKTKPGMLPTLPEVMAAVSHVTGVRRDVIVSETRSLYIINARCLYYWIARNYSAHSLSEIGKRCGCRDHSTVVNGINKVDASYETYRAAIERILAVLEINQADRIAA